MWVNQEIRENGWPTAFQALNRVPYKKLLKKFWFKSEAWSSGIDLKVGGTEKKEEEFLDGYLDGKRQLYESHGFPSGLVLVSIFRIGWQKKKVRLWILQALHSKFRGAKMRTVETHKSKWISNIVAPGGDTDRYQGGHIAKKKQSPFCRESDLPGTLNIPVKVPFQWRGVPKKKPAKKTWKIRVENAVKLHWFPIMGGQVLLCVWDGLVVLGATVSPSDPHGIFKGALLSPVSWVHR